LDKEGDFVAINRSVLGTGMKFPPQINPATGRFVTSSEAESVKESIYLILTTTKSERFMRPEYGSRVVSYAFADTSQTMLTIMRNEIYEDIKSNEPRISEISIEMDARSKQGCLLINIDYTLISTQERDNLVFPFYLSNDQPESNESEIYETME